MAQGPASLEQKKDLQKLETLEQKDIPALEKAFKDYHIACMETKDVGNKLGAELRRLGEIVSDNEWAACFSRVGDVQHFYENIFGDCVEKVLLDGVIEPLKRYSKEESNTASHLVDPLVQDHIRRSKTAVKAFEDLTQKRTAQSMAKKTTTADMLNILRAEKQEAELKTAMLHFCKTYDAHRCFKIICLINDFMRGQLTYHEAVHQKHRELVAAWKPLLDKKLNDFDVPRDPEDRIEKKGVVETVHNAQLAARVATTIKNLLPAQYGASLRPNVARHSMVVLDNKPATPPLQPSNTIASISNSKSTGTAKKSDLAAIAQPVKPEPSSAFKSKEQVRQALMMLQQRLTELSPSQISMEITRVLLMLDDTYIPPTNSSLSSTNLNAASLTATSSSQSVAASASVPALHTQSKGHGSMQAKRLSVGSLSEFIEEKPPAKPAAADRVNSSIDEILAGFLDTTGAKPPSGAPPAPPISSGAGSQSNLHPTGNGMPRSASAANITDELMALIDQPTSPKPPAGAVTK